MVKRVNERKGRCAVKGTTVVESRGDAHRCLVDIGNTKINLPHDGVFIVLQ